MEEALWNFEDKWKLSTQEAAAFFACTAVLVTGICIVTIVRRRATKRRGLVHQEPCQNGAANEANWGDRKHPKNWGCVKKMLMGSVRWSGVSKWEERRLSGSQRERASPLLVVNGRLGRCEDNVGRYSHNSSSAVWQRPILMGEKCELPRFSGLILYDEKGVPLDHHADNGSTADFLVCHQEINFDLLNFYVEISFHSPALYVLCRPYLTYSLLKLMLFICPC